MGKSSRDLEPAFSINIGDHAYYIFDEKVTWEQARINCESLGGYLATFASEEEWKPMQLLLQSNQLHCWFGGYGNGSIETWKWITGEKWTYSDWCRGVPNNDFNGSENYLGTWTSTYQWNDYRPDTLLGFICEIGEVEELPIL